MKSCLFHIRMVEMKYPPAPLCVQLLCSIQSFYPFNVPWTFIFFLNKHRVYPHSTTCNDDDNSFRTLNVSRPSPILMTNPRTKPFHEVNSPASTLSNQTPSLCFCPPCTINTHVKKKHWQRQKLFLFLELLPAYTATRARWH